VDSQTWESAARFIAILAGVIFGSAAISAAVVVWVRKQVFAYGGSALCVAGVVLLGLSIWQTVEFGVSATGLNFKAAQGIVQSAVNSVDQAAKAAKTAELAKAQNPTDAAVAMAAEDARKSVEHAQ
jgi:hypothetical protein